jgi:hypothetical protein
MKFSILILIIFSICTAGFGQDKKVPAAGSEERVFVNDFTSGDNISKAYRVLSMNGKYDEKKKAVKIFRENYTNERVLNMMVDLLKYYYDNPDFRENNQEVYYDDVIAQDLAALLGTNCSPACFPALINIAVYNHRHRDLTVKAAWDSIRMIKWQ